MVRSVAHIILLAGIFSVWIACDSQKSRQQDKTAFTKVDSLTETYLTLQDSLLHAWNVMTWDEKEKIDHMHDIIHLMQRHGGFDDQELISLEQRLDQLERIRFTQKSLSNAYVIEEYDFASNSLVSEIISRAEADTEFMKNEKNQKLVDKIKLADHRVNSYREAYDQIAMRFNQFLESHKKYIDEIDKDQTGEKRALFQMAVQ